MTSPELISLRKQNTELKAQIERLGQFALDVREHDAMLLEALAKTSLETSKNYRKSQRYHEADFMDYLGPFLEQQADHIRQQAI